MSVINTYLDNVKNAVHRNLRNYLKHEPEKDEFLARVIAYCEKLKLDPDEPKIKRKRIRSGHTYETGGNPCPKN
jgi:hypothetical protein